MSWLTFCFHQYKSKRIVNINVNITLSLFISSLITSFIVAYFSTLVESAIWLLVITAVVDSICNIFSFGLLHRFANNLGGKKLIHDTVVVQVHRIFLAPLYYGVAALFQYFFLNAGLGVQASIISAYSISIVVSRIVHTIYCVRTGFFKDK